MNTGLAPQFERLLTNSFNEKYLYSVNRDVFKNNDAQTVFDKYFKNKLWNDETFHLIIGSDSGLLVNYILKHGIPTGSRYLIVELPHILQIIKPLLNKHKDIQFCTPDEWEQEAEAFSINTYIFKDKIQFHKSLGAADANIFDYHQIVLGVETALQNKVFITRANLGNQHFIIHQIENISDNLYPAQLLYQSFKGKTCIILGGGPSLDEQLNWVRENKNNIVIMAASRISGKLIKENIIPHIIFAIDPQKINLEICKEMFMLPKEVLFIHSYHVAPSLLSQWQGKSLYLGPRVPWESKLNQTNIAMAGPTVTQTAIAAAIEFGFKKILLTGVDLCFSQTGFTHTKDTVEANNGPKLGHDGQWVDTYKGEKAETLIQFIFAIETMVEQAKFAVEHGIDIINLSENAAKIAGINYQPTSQIKLESDKHNALEIFNKAIPEYNQDFVLEDHEKLAKEVSHIIRNLEKIYHLSQDALKFNSAFFSKKTSPEKSFKFKTKIDKIEKKLGEEYKIETRFIKTFGIYLFLKSVSSEPQENWTEEQMEASGKIYYQAYIDTTRKLLKLLKKTSMKLNARIEESKSFPSFGKIFKQWESDAEYGRANNWSDSHPQLVEKLNGDTRSKLTQFKQQFEQFLSNTDTEYSKIIKKQSTLAGVKSKALNMYQQKNHQGLNQLVNALAFEKEKEKEKEDEESSYLYHFSKSLLYSLNDEKAEALNELEKISKQEKHEEVLKQIASLSLSLNQLEKAESVLAILASKADVYIPPFAQVLKLNNKVQESIEIYTNYLSNNPLDIPNWLALGKLYVDINAIESAKMTFEHILTMDPKNDAAKMYLDKLNQLVR